MLNARRQAEGHARALPVSHGWPPCILVCDVAHAIETCAHSSSQGNQAQVTGRQSFRIGPKTMMGMDRSRKVAMGVRAGGSQAPMARRRLGSVGSAIVGGWPVDRSGSGDAEDVEKGLPIRAGGRVRGMMRAAIGLAAAAFRLARWKRLRLTFSAIAASPLPLRSIRRKRSTPAEPTHPWSSPASRRSAAIVAAISASVLPIAASRPV